MDHLCTNPLCRTRTQTHDPRSGSDPLKPGDIISVSVSISLPFQEAVSHDFSLSNDARSYAMKSLRSLSKTAPINPRPALIIGPLVERAVSSPAQMHPPTMICCLTRFGGNEIDLMPRLLRHFIMPIYPTTHDIPHLHTDPEWSTDPDHEQWIIAFPVSLPREHGCRWWNSGTHCAVSSEALTAFKAFCITKKFEWDDMSPQERKEWVAEYHVCPFPAIQPFAIPLMTSHLCLGASQEQEIVRQEMCKHFTFTF